MEAKDWILLLVPILCNGIFVFVLQRIFEKKQLATTEKYAYIAILKQKIDKALGLFTNVLRTVGDDPLQINWLQQFCDSYSDVFYYYIQNEVLFKALKSHMDEISKTNEQIKSELQQSDSPTHTRNLESLLRNIYKALQAIQSDCINHKV